MILKEDIETLFEDKHKKHELLTFTDIILAYG